MIAPTEPGPARTHWATTGAEAAPAYVGLATDGHVKERRPDEFRDE